jgi:hypothetical protein
VAHAFLEDIPEGRFTEATVRRMYELVDQGKTDAPFQKLIYGIVNKSMRGNWKDYRREVEVLLEWFKKRHDYRRDPHNVELLQDVWATLDRRRFDCDDATIFMCAGAEILGAPCRIVTVSTRSNKEPSHVYAQAFLEGRWQGVDAIMPWAPVGWEPVDGVTAKKIWTRQDVGLSGYDEPVMEGLGRMKYLEDSNPEGWTDERYNVGPRRNHEGGFASRGRMVVNQTGVPNDGSDTFAPGMPGTAVIPNRRTPPSQILLSADAKILPLPGDIELSRYPITSHQTPGQLWTNLPGNEMPLDFDKHIWTGEVPVNESVVDYTLPQPYANSEEQIVDLQGLGGIGMYNLEGMSNSEVDAELDGLEDNEVEEQLQQLGYFLGDEDGSDGMLGRKKKKGFFRKRLAKHKKMHRKMMLQKKKKKNRNEGFSEGEGEVGAAHDQGLHREGALEMAPGQQVSGLGAFSSLTDSYLSDFEAGNPGYLADAYIDSELQMEGVSLGALTRDERKTLRAEYKKCRAEAHKVFKEAKRACRQQFKVHRNEERLDGLASFLTREQLRSQGMSGLDCCPPGMRGLGAIDWMSAVSGIASNIVSGVTGGAIPASTVQGAVNTAVSYYTGTGKVPTTQQIATQAPPTVVQKAAFGMGMLVPIGIGVFILSKVMGKKGRRR